MKKEKDTPKDTGLRRRAEDRLRGEKREIGPSPAEEDARRMVHELQVHQIELELQNEELKQTRQALERQLEKYSDLYNFAPVGYFTLDRDGTIREANLTSAKLLGIERPRMVGRRLGSFLSHESRPAFDGFLTKVYEGTAAETCEVALHGDRLRHLQIEGIAVESDERKPWQGRMAAMDITERKNAEKALLRAHDDLEQRVQERTTDIRNTNRLLQFFTVQSSKKEYLDEVVKLLQEWTGCEALGIRVLTKEGDIPYESYVGFTKDFWESENFLSIHWDQCVCIRVVTGGPEPQDMPYITAKGSFYCDDTMELLSVLSDEAKGRFRGKCIATGYASVTVIPISYRGKILGAVHLADRQKAKVPWKMVEFIESIQPLIGEAIHRLDLEEEGERLEQQLRQAHKMEAIGTLAGGIAHDFNNILAAIIGFSEMARDKTPEESPARRHMERVFDAGIRGRDLVKRILTFSRKAEQEKQPLRLAAVVEETLKLLRASLPTTIDIRMNLQSEPGFVLADPTQVQQVVMNLCTNAAHAMRRTGGNISIDLTGFSFSSPEDAPDPTMSPGLYARLSVTDTGEGMPPAVFGRIFDPFFTTKAQGEGTGLGLSVVHGIVASHGGTITVSSEQGKGSTFNVYLPVYGKEQPRDSGDGEDSVPRGHERVLFIDDEEDLVAIGDEMLTDLGYHVASKTGAREALALFRLDPSRFDLVITDQTMPEITGEELVQEILAIRTDMPIIMCTGFSPLVDAKSARATGARAFVMKPLTKKEIAATIRKVLDE